MYCSFRQIEQVNVMFQLPSRTINHHQQTQIEHLTYENQLLLERNRLLALENQCLLDELQISHDKLSNTGYVSTKQVLEDYKEIIGTINSSFACLENKMGKDLDKKIETSLRSLSMRSQGDFDAKSLFSNFADLIITLTQGYRSLRSQKVKGKLAEKEEKLNSRRMARQRTDRVLHIIKEPEELTQYATHFTQELKHQRQFFQRLLIKIRKESISMRFIESILSEFDKGNKVRWALKNQQSDLTLLERQFELGWIQPASLEETILKIKQFSEELAEIRQSIDQHLQSI